MKLGRNDPCPCGSGKKYKKCCSPKFDQPIVQPVSSRVIPSSSKLPVMPALSKAISGFWMPNQLDRMSDEAIVEKMMELGISVSQEQFVADLTEHLDAYNVTRIWEERYEYHLTGKDADFPYCAALQMSKRWAPEIFTDKLIDLMHEMESIPRQANDQMLDIYRIVWEKLKQYYIAAKGFKSFDELQKEYDWVYDVETIVYDYEMELGNAMIDANNEKMQALHLERVALCEDIQRLLPENNPHNLLNLRKSIAESYGNIEDFVKADQLFTALTSEHPDWVWGYVGWGHVYTKKGEHYLPEKAVKIYEIGLLHIQQDRDVLQERLDDLKKRLPN